MARARTFSIPAVFVLAIVMAAAFATPATAYSTHLGARLNGSASYSYAAGHADYERCCGHREFNVHMWNMGKVSGSTLGIFVNGNKLGSMRVGSDGRCHYHRDNAPQLHRGDVVTIKTSRGALVASGRLRHRMMM